MKKILAMATAVAMFASMAATAVAAPAPVEDDAETEAAIVFVSGRYVPEDPIFCPDDKNVFDSGFGSIDLDFGYIEIPAVGPNVITFYAEDAVDDNDVPLPRSARFLGIGIQAWLDMSATPVVGHGEGEWTLEARLRPFYVEGTATQTLQGFDLYLDQNEDVPGQPAETFGTGIETYPRVVDLAALNDAIVVEDVVLVQCDNATPITSDMAVGDSGMMFGWEWEAMLRGIHVGGNISPNEKQADIEWTFVLELD